MASSPLKPLKQLKRLAVSKDFFREPFAVTNLQTGQLINPTGLNIYWTLVAEEADPAPGTWMLGDWETTSDGVYLGRIMIGPPDGSFVMARGSVYDLYARLSADPEAPVYGPWRITAT